MLLKFIYIFIFKIYMLDDTQAICFKANEIFLILAWIKKHLVVIPCHWNDSDCIPVNQYVNVYYFFKTKDLTNIKYDILCTYSQGILKILINNI